MLRSWRTVFGGEGTWLAKSNLVGISASMACGVCRNVPGLVRPPTPTMVAKLGDVLEPGTPFIHIHIDSVDFGNDTIASDSAVVPYHLDILPPIHPALLSDCPACLTLPRTSPHRNLSWKRYTRGHEARSKLCESVAQTMLPYVELCSFSHRSRQSLQ